MPLRPEIFTQQPLAAQESSPLARGCRTWPTSELGRHANSPGGDWRRRWSWGGLRRAPAAEPGRCTLPCWISGEEQGNAEKFAVEESRGGPRGASGGVVRRRARAERGVFRQRQWWVRRRSGKRATSACMHEGGGQRPFIGGSSLCCEGKAEE
jgi:hypothetical protein